MGVGSSIHVVWLKRKLDDWELLLFALNVRYRCVEHVLFKSYPVSPGRSPSILWLRPTLASTVLACALEHQQSLRRKPEYVALPSATTFQLLSIWLIDCIAATYGVGCAQQWYVAGLLEREAQSSGLSALPIPWYTFLFVNSFVRRSRIDWMRGEENVRRPKYYAVLHGLQDP